MNTVSPSYFSLIAIPIVRGRTFTRGRARRSVTRRHHHRGDGPTLLARRRSDRPDARHGPGRDREATLEIVGVARDAQVSQVGGNGFELPVSAGDPERATRLGLLVRSQLDFAALAASHPLDDAGARSRSRRHESTGSKRIWILAEPVRVWLRALSGSLSLLALVLASVGVYGVVSYVVSRRRREVGIRMTLGATARDVQSLFLRQTLRPVVIGAVIGIAAAAAASRILESVLFGISPLRSDRIHRRPALSPDRRGRRKLPAHTRGAQSRPDGDAEVRVRTLTAPSVQLRATSHELLATLRSLRPSNPP